MIRNGQPVPRHPDGRPFSLPPPTSPPPLPPPSPSRLLRPGPVRETGALARTAGIKRHSGNVAKDGQDCHAYGRRQRGVCRIRSLPAAIRPTCRTRAAGRRAAPDGTPDRGSPSAAPPPQASCPWRTCPPFCPNTGAGADAVIALTAFDHAIRMVWASWRNVTMRASGLSEPDVRGAQIHV